MQQNKEKLLSFVSDADSKSRAVMLENPAARNSRKMKHNPLQDRKSENTMLRHELRLLRNSPAMLCSACPASIHQHRPHPLGIVAIQGLFQESRLLAAPGERRCMNKRRFLCDCISARTAGNPNESSIAATKPLGESPSFHRTLSADKLEALFNHVDKNHDGVLNVREMTED